MEAAVAVLAGYETDTEKENADLHTRLDSIYKLLTQAEKELDKEESTYGRSDCSRTRSRLLASLWEVFGDYVPIKS